MNQKGYCPVEFSETQLRNEERKCTGCSLCAISCPEVAIEVIVAKVLMRGNHIIGEAAILAGVPLLLRLSDHPQNELAGVHG